MKELVLKVKGMHCEGCENRIKNSIGTVEGVEEVVANHVSGLVTIKYAKEVNEAEIKEKLDDLGFEVKED